jgi:hypothetical protein
MPYMRRDRPPTPEQRELAAKLSVQVEPFDTIGVAGARLTDALIDFLEPPNGWRKAPRHDPPSPDQMELAEQIQVNIGNATARVAFELIADRLEALKHAAITRKGIRPGETFCLETPLDGHTVVVVKSVGPDGSIRLVGDRGMSRRPDDLHPVHG